MTSLSRPPVTRTTLLDLLTAAPGADTETVALLPDISVPAPRERGRSVSPLRLLRAQLRAPLLMAARTVLRNAQVRQLALRILKRFPTLYAGAYRMMMAPGAGAAQPVPGDAGDPSLSPRAASVLRSLRALQTVPLRASGQRMRLALVSPMPPERTGVASYAVELLEHLAVSFDIELVLSQAEVSLPSALAGVPRRTVAWFVEHGGEYDQVLYQIGNSPFHSHMFALLALHPGVVVLHDFFLGGVLAHAQMSGTMPHAWSDALFHAHGYEAVRISEDPQHNAQMHRDWPCSLGVLETATRVIVHSAYARRLAYEWYGPQVVHNIDVIPHPRAAPAVLDRAAARAALGIADDCFLVCSFGFVAPNKLTHELLQAWCKSALHADAQCTLVLVGANHDSPYGVQVEELIRAAGPLANIRIAGWTDQAVYRYYLQAADVGVQLRTNARGESSGAVLDCMNYGLATIVNANGSMAEFPPDAVWRLPDAFSIPDLSGALEVLWRDPAQRQRMGQRAVAVLDTGFRPADCALLYLATLAQARADSAAQKNAWIAALAEAAPADDAALRGLAEALAHGADSRARQRQLLFDATSLDAWSGAQLRELLEAPRPGLRIVPVYLDTDGTAPRYREATNATGQLLGLAWPVQAEPLVDVDAGDIFYAPDASAPSVAAAVACGLVATWRARGVAINLLVREGDAAAHPLAATADRLLHLPQPA
jgi:glycosyltransferase involved in cell wall biosynthesis